MKPGAQSSDFRVKIKTLLLFCTAVLLLILLSIQPLAFSDEKWPGVDETVIERFAEEHGMEAKDPLINTDQGDLLLFVFLIAGAGGGFVAGYYWRTLTDNRGQNSEARMQVTENK